MNNLFPSFAETSTVKEESAYKPDLQEFEIDPETGTLTGGMVKGKDRIRTWIWKCLRTERFHYAIYSWAYGSELESYIGRVLTQEYIDTDVRLAVQEALLENEEITGITDFSAVTDGSLITINLTVSTVYGNVEGTYYV
ncbi:MAG: DUF2634 domain-containing protein [Lachnospiraceae bacterium]|nr:DUF2634 domain-containing protein [Lachnospiraceae bacterium]